MSEVPLIPKLEIGEIVQLHPEKTANKAFSGCLLVVTKIYPWGVQGYVQGLGPARDVPDGQAYYRAIFGTFMPTGGKAVWMPAQ